MRPCRPAAAAVAVADSVVADLRAVVVLLVVGLRVVVLPRAILTALIPMARSRVLRPRRQLLVRLPPRALAGLRGPVVAPLLPVPVAHARLGDPVPVARDAVALALVAHAPTRRWN